MVEGERASVNHAPPRTGAGNRQERAERRREAILRATLALVGRQGSEAVTHRAVAREAGVPLASTTYYFASKDELLEEALLRAVREELALLEGLVERLRARDAAPEEWITGLSAVLAGDLARDPTRQLAAFELLLEAARRPALREAIAAWKREVERLAATGLRASGASDPEQAAAVLVAALLGFGLEQLAVPHERYEREVLRPALERLVAGLLTSP